MTLFRTINPFGKRLWVWFQAKSQGPRAALWLGIYSFLHAFLVPIPTDLLLAPMVVANRARAAYFTLVAALGGTIGAAVGYGIAALAYDTVAPFVAFMGFADDVTLLATSLDQFTFLATLITALTPLPDVPLIIAAGVFGMNPMAFISAYFFGRMLRLSAATIFTLLGVSLISKK